MLRKYLPLVHEDLGATYSRNLHHWLLIAPIIGVTTGLVVTAVAVIILKELWPVVFGYYLHHHWLMVPGVALGFVITGLIMQFFTPDPDEHSTEEIIRSYHDHQGDIDMQPFLPKLLAAVTTVGFGGSAALEGPSIYGGGAIGSWLWTRYAAFQFEPRDRRIMLISGAAAGMAAVFRAPLTGLVFALEMPYKDDLAHEALLPSLIASVVSYVTLAFFLGATPLFDFTSSHLVYRSGSHLVRTAGCGDRPYRHDVFYNLPAGPQLCSQMGRAALDQARRGRPVNWFVRAPLCFLLQGLARAPGPELRSSRLDFGHATQLARTSCFRLRQVGRNYFFTCLRRSKRHVRAAFPYRRFLWNVLSASRSFIAPQSNFMRPLAWPPSFPPVTRLRLPLPSSSQRPPAVTLLSSRR